MPAKSKTPSKTSIPFASRVRKFKGEALMHYLEVPCDVVKRLGGKLMVRLICEIPKAKISFHCALMSLGKGEACIFFSQEKMRITGAKVGQALPIRVRLDSSRYGMKLPAEMAEVFKQEPEARRRFNRLSPGKQRNIIFHISSTKDEERRVDRSVQLFRDLMMMPEGQEAIAVLLNPALKEGHAFQTPAEEAEFRRRIVPSSDPV